MNAARAFARLLRDVPRHDVFGLLVLMILVGFTEGVGILLLVPLLDLLQDGSAGRFSGWWQAIGFDTSSAASSTFSSASTFSPASSAPFFAASATSAPSAPLLLILFLLLVALRSALVYGRERMASRIQYQVVDALRQRCFGALLRSEWRWLAARRQSDHASLLLTDINRVGTGLNYGLLLLASLATSAAYIAAALLLSWPLTAIALASGGMVVLLLGGQRRAALRLGQSLGDANRALHGNVQQSLAAIKLAKILRTEQRHERAFATTVAHLRAQQLHFTAATSLSKALFQLLGAGLLAACVYIGLRVLHTPVPELLTLVLIFSRLMPLFMAAQQQLHLWLNAVPAFDDSERLLAECARVAEPAGADTENPWPVTRGIALRDVTVRHVERAAAALDALSLDLPARTSTVVMGASGAGKSTLADVLMALLVPDEGRLLVDGATVEGEARQRWRESVAYVPQEVFLFNDSIRNNLLWARPASSEAELQLALQRAAAGFALQLPQGLDTVVGDSGVRLSGGERQRLALARALLKRPSLLILDEATSALDTDNESRVLDAIEQLHGDLTMVIISHRPALFRQADQIIVLERGRLVSRVLKATDEERAPSSPDSSAP